MPLADPFKDLKWSNVPEIKLSSLSKLDDTFTSLQALSNLHYLFSGFMDYFWSRKLNISNFGSANRFSASMFSSLISSAWASRIYDGVDENIIDEHYHKFIQIWFAHAVHKVVSSVIGGILSIEARDMDKKLLSALESNNTLAKCWFRGNVTIASSGWPFVSTVPGQMTHLVASMTLDSARSCVMQGAFLTQVTVSNIPIVFSWGGSISPEGFRPSILLLTGIVVAVAIVVDAIIRIVVVVVGVPSIIKLAFVITGDLVGLFYSNRLGVCIPPEQGVIVFAMIAACVSRAAVILSAANCLMAA
nr:hypothetical protein [Tanacetum cinerariifolium]